jgi:hypothetical protein
MTCSSSVVCVKGGKLRLSNKKSNAFNYLDLVNSEVTGSDCFRGQNNPLRRHIANLATPNTFCCLVSTNVESNQFVAAAACSM